MIAALLIPLAVLMLLRDHARNWDNALATLLAAGLFLHLAIRPSALPFLDDPAVPDE